MSSSPTSMFLAKYVHDCRRPVHLAHILSSSWRVISSTSPIVETSSLVQMAWSASPDSQLYPAFHMTSLIALRLTLLCRL